MDGLCGWLNDDLAALGGGDDVLRVPRLLALAILAHLYLAWIHPFGDGNGRIARFLEFEIMLRAGIPVATNDEECARPGLNDWAEPIHGRGEALMGRADSVVPRPGCQSSPRSAVAGSALGARVASLWPHHRAKKNGMPT